MKIQVKSLGFGPERLRVAKFIATGGAAFGVEYVSFLLLYYLTPAGVVPSNIIGFSLGVITSFSLNRSWVFSSGAGYKSQFAKYLTLAVINLVVTTGLVGWMSMALEPAVAKIIVVVMVAVWNYFIYKKIIFRH